VQILLGVAAIQSFGAVDLAVHASLLLKRDVPRRMHHGEGLLGRCNGRSNLIGKRPLLLPDARLLHGDLLFAFLNDYPVKLNGEGLLSLVGLRLTRLLLE